MERALRVPSESGSDEMQLALRSSFLRFGRFNKTWGSISTRRFLLRFSATIAGKATRLRARGTSVRFAWSRSSSFDGLIS